MQEALCLAIWRSKSGVAYVALTESTSSLLHGLTRKSHAAWPGVPVSSEVFVHVWTACLTYCTACWLSLLLLFWTTPQKLRVSLSMDISVFLCLIKLDRMKKRDLTFNLRDAGQQVKLLWAYSTSYCKAGQVVIPILPLLLEGLSLSKHQHCRQWTSLWIHTHFLCYSHIHFVFFPTTLPDLVLRLQFFYRAYEV